MAFSYPFLQGVQISMVKYSPLIPGTHWDNGFIPPNHYAVIWSVDGPDSLAATVDGRTVPLPTGTVLLLRPGYAWELENRREGKRPAMTAELWFDFRKLPRGWPPEADWPLVQTPPVDSAVFPLLRFALTLGTCAEPERTAFGQAVFPLLLMMLLTGRHAQHRPQVANLPEPLERVWTIVRQYGATPGKRAQRLPELAREAGMSVGHLTHLFNRHLGISPGEFMQCRRLEHAASLLGGSPLRIKEIARVTGFCNQFHFSQQFRKLFGCAPSQYREMPGERRPVASVLERLKTPVPESLEFASYASTDLLHRVGGMGAPAAVLMQELRRDLAANRSQFEFPPLSRKRWHPLSLVPFANRPRQSGPDALFGPGTRHPCLPTGSFRAHGIPFVLPGEAGPGDRSVILLRSARLRECQLPESVALPVNGRVAGIGVLHACAWVLDRHLRLGDYEIRYADGRHISLPVMTWGGPATGVPRPAPDTIHPVLQDYWPIAPQIKTRFSLPVTVVDPEHPLTSIHYLYAFWWENPRPDIPLRHLVLRGHPDTPGLLAVLGITVLAAPPRLRPPSQTA